MGNETIYSSSLALWEVANHRPYMVSARIWGMGSLCHKFVTTFGRSSIKWQAMTVACGGRETRSCHRPLLWAELLFHGAFPGWASLRRAFLMHSDANLRLSNFPLHMGISGPLEYKMFKGDDPVPSLEYEGWVFSSVQSLSHV